MKFKLGLGLGLGLQSAEGATGRRPDGPKILATTV